MRGVAAIGWLMAALSVPAAAAEPSLSLLPQAYPGAVATIADNTIVFADGFRLDAGSSNPAASFQDILQHASVRDMFRLSYPLGAPLLPPPVDFDPGRFRNKAFFDHLYGDCRKGEVERNLVAVPWLPLSAGRSVYVNQRGGAAAHLREVSAELERLPLAIRRAAYPIAGTYACRSVADSGQPSMHAYGAAIDLNLAYSDYWLWQAGRNGAIQYRNRMPREIIDAFERHGFIWGGRWYHYDTMHFEYRPELLAR
ncbi:MAG: M15 family metallopeptidase [Rhizomicrobium sp.]|nr:M15 family metallopeptidase [Rhizomicrobium sp.]